VDRVRLTAPRAESILDQVANPSDLEVTLEAGAMVRIVDVARALAAISYPESLDGRVAIAVSDSLVDWNDATFDFAVADGTATIERTNETADVKIGIGPLSQLVVGHRTLSALETANDATVHDREAAALLESAFPASKVYLREGF
jgi:predicted acetyltransferase